MLDLPHGDREASAEPYEILANSADGVYAVDTAQTIVLWNRSAADILGYTPKETLGRKCYEVVRGRSADGCAVCRHRCEAIDAAERGDLPATIDISTRTYDGRDIWLNVSSIVVPSPRPELTVLVHVFREVTTRYQVVRLARQLAEVVAHPSRSRAKSAAAPRDDAGVVRLTKREREVLRLLAIGRSTEEIGERLCVSPRTVRNHVTNILAKLGLHSRLEAVTHAIRNKLV